MAAKSMTMGFMTRGPRFEAPSRHAALVAGFRAKLANKKSPLDSIAPEHLEQARKEFRELPEVAGEPLPAPKRVQMRQESSEMAGRLAKLKADDMPWLSKKGLEALAEAPEVSGPPSYKKPAGWR